MVEAERRASCRRAASSAKYTAMFACAPACGWTFACSAPKSVLRAVDRELLDLVDDLAAAVVALAGIALGVLVRRHRADGLEDARPGEVLGRDQLDLAALPLELAAEQRRRSRGRRRRGRRCEAGRAMPGRRPCRSSLPRDDSMLEDGGDGPERLVGRNRTLPQHHGLGPGEVDHGRRRSRQLARRRRPRRPPRGSPPAPRRGVAGPARPARLALVATMAPTRDEHSRAARSSAGTRTPIVSGRVPVSQRVPPRRDSAGRACTARAGARARSHRPRRAARAGIRTARSSRPRRAPSAGVSSRPFSRYSVGGPAPPSTASRPARRRCRSGRRRARPARIASTAASTSDTAPLDDPVAARQVRRDVATSAYPSSSSRAAVVAACPSPTSSTSAAARAQHVERCRARPPRRAVADERNVRLPVAHLGHQRRQLLRRRRRAGSRRRGRTARPEGRRRRSCSSSSISSPVRAAFSRASASASGDTSIAVTCAPGRSSAIASAIAPVPVPTSSTRGDWRARAGAASARSTTISVSGRGISARRVDGEREPAEAPLAEDVRERLARAPGARRARGSRRARSRSAAGRSRCRARSAAARARARAAARRRGAASRSLVPEVLVRAGARNLAAADGHASSAAPAILRLQRLGELLEVAVEDLVEAVHRQLDPVVGERGSPGSCRCGSSRRARPSRSASLRAAESSACCRSRSGS